MDGSLYFSPGGISQHSEQKASGEKYNESNPGFGLEYEWQKENLKNFLLAGKYLNSLNKDSYYVGGGQKLNLLGDKSLYLDGGYTGGLITGYNNSVIPALMPTLSVGGTYGAADLMYVPKIENLTPETYMIKLRIPMK